jgi:photosystem II stability/assembly factor-like uncharacterized protein
LGRPVLWLALSLVLSALGHALSGAGLPFDLTWVEGKCMGCTMPWSLGATLFTSPSEAWAVGATGPKPGTEGMGYRALLHTKDGGHIWTEVPRTEYYAIPPSVAFLDVKMGWVETHKAPAADEVVLQTRNGGESWESATGKLPVFPHILDANHWWGIQATPLVGAADKQIWSRALVRTADGGRTWSKTPLPNDAGDFPVVKFLSANVGWIGNVAGDEFVIFRTTDAGKTWQRSLTASPRRPVRVTDLFFLDRNRGWLIVDYPLREGFNGDGSYVFATTDGGTTWIRQPSEAFQGGLAFWISFLSKRLGFASVEGTPQTGEAGQAAATLAYTSDAGDHWHKVAVPNYVAGCQAFGGDLLCSAQGEKSRLIVLTVRPK